MNIPTDPNSDISSLATTFQPLQVNRLTTERLLQLHTNYDAAFGALLNLCSVLSLLSGEQEAKLYATTAKMLEPSLLAVQTELEKRGFDFNPPVQHLSSWEAFVLSLKQIWSNFI